MELVKTGQVGMVFTVLKVQEMPKEEGEDLGRVCY